MQHQVSQTKTNKVLKMITTELLAILLNEERNENDRLDSLYELKDYLDQEDIITALANLAKKEQSLAIREALLEIVVKAEITNLTNKDQYLNILFHFSSIEKEEKIRLIAVEYLSKLAFQDDRIELLLAENLLYDTSESIQESCLFGLQKTNCKYDTTIDTLTLYAQKVSSENITPFITLLAKLPTVKSEPILVALLHPVNNNTIKIVALNELARHPSLQASTLQSILDILLEDTGDAALETAATTLLTTRVLKDLSIIDTIIKSLSTSPANKTKLLPLLNKLILTEPVIVEKLKKLYRKTTSVALKSTFLTLLSEANALDISKKALTDSNLQIRYLALHYCSENIEQDTQGIVKAILHAIKQEPNIQLRTSLADAIKNVEYLNETSEKTLLACCAKEENPWVLEPLAKAIALVPLRDNNKETLLKIYIKILDETFFTDNLKDHVINQLSNFAYTNTPELTQCLTAFMLREFNINRVARLYDQYSKLKLAENEHIAFVLQLFERFIHYYPHHLLNTWANELKQKVTSNKNIGKKAAFLAKITGDNHFLVNQGALSTTSPLVENMIASIRKREEYTANKLLQDAYQNRTLKKKEIVQLLEILLISFDNTGLVYKILDILKEQRLITIEIVNIALDFINAYPETTLTFSVEQILNSMGKNLPEYAQSLEQNITPSNFLEYSLKTAQIRSDYRLAWHENWKDIYGGWAMGKLWLELYPSASLLKFFNKTNQTEKDNQSLDYYILRKLSRTSIRKEEIIGEQTITGEDVLLTIGNRIEQLEPDDTSGSLYDRILYVFSTKWKEFVTHKEQPSEALMQCATKINYALFKRWQNYQKRVSHELLDIPLWLDFDLFSKLLKEDNLNFNDFFAPYYQLIKTEAQNKIQKLAPQREQPPRYRAKPTFDFFSSNNCVVRVIDIIITAKWPATENQILEETLTLTEKVWKGAVKDRLQMIAEKKRNEVLQQL